MFQYASTEGFQQLMESTLEGLLDLRDAMDGMQKTVKTYQNELDVLIENMVVMGG